MYAIIASVLAKYPWSKGVRLDVRLDVEKIEATAAKT
jgi:hypothetical protein